MTDPNYQTVLVPTDGSEAATAAVEHALGVATRYDAALHAAFVVDAAGMGAEAMMVEDTLERQGESVLEDVRERAVEAGVETVETALLAGAPHRQILDYADDHGVDVIVMGTHGRRGIERYLLGSVTEKVVRLAEVPVLAVHHDPEGEFPEEGTADEEAPDDEPAGDGGGQ